MLDFNKKHAYLAHLNTNEGMTVLKALDSGSQVAQTLERQDLESEMERLNILETPFYDKLSKVKATAREHEYNVITSRQDKIGYAAYKDGGLPRTVEVELTRRRILPTLIGQRITLTELALATTQNGVEPIDQVARDEKIVAVMEETEYLLMYGDRRFGSQNFDSTVNLQFDGIENIIKRGAPQNILDLEGKPLTLKALWEAENKVYQTQGLAKPTQIFMSPIDKINLQSQFYQLARTDKAERLEGLLGAEAQYYISAFGRSDINTSRFLGNWHRYSNLGFGTTAGEYARPASPTGIASALATTGTDLGLENGVQYTYAVKAANFWGESDAVIATPRTTANANQKINLTFTAIDPNTKWFIIYRMDGTGEGAKFKYLKKVPYYGGAITLGDDGHQVLRSGYGNFRKKLIPGTGFVAGVDMMTTSLAQWITLEQVPLPQYLTQDWVIRHVSSLFARAPEFNFLIINVGQDIE